jgi:hypothetical protein
MEKIVLKSIPLYWIYFVWIPKGVLEISQKTRFKFIWAGSKDQFVAP